ncbi:4-hydroxy-tetrahydrodipicolinate synthase [Treponema sp.]|uniref:4-hydroxy-tetrahydrodipicolinate synthase n=1 Tax=Treponema sp. TaxID=166 RepID=UPI00298D7783|nr:4-hydroxy-tetrahydrodipicolinate synthase [Treponema sp.]MCR5612218.1 4-hydroxy-tetrahydrodipicolinate synthase [Treponema sp.]
MNRLRGTFTALITPMNSDGSVDYEGFRKNVKYQLEGGVTGLVPLGTTAETPTLDEKPGSEEDTLINILMEEVKAFRESTGKDVPVILGAGSNNTKDAVMYTERAKAVGADYALVVTPYYNKPSKEGIFRHFEAVSKVGIPIIVYNIKGRTGVNIPTDVLVRIAQLPNIAGVKEASGDISQMMDVIAQIKNKKPDFAVLSGDDGLTLPLLAAGGDGVISVVSNLCPSRVAALVQAGLDGDFAKARELHYGLAPMFKAAFVDGNPTSIKYAMNYKGLPAGTVRLPLVDVTDSAKKTIEKAMDECNI